MPPCQASWVSLDASTELYTPRLSGLQASMGVFSLYLLLVIEVLGIEVDGLTSQVAFYMGLEHGSSGLYGWHFHWLSYLSGYVLPFRRTAKLFAKVAAAVK